LLQVSWRWFFWACTIAQAINLLGLIFFLPETRYNRREQTSEPRSHDSPIDVDSNEKPSTAAVEIESNQAQMTNPDEYLGKGRPSRQQFNAFQPTDRKALSEVWRHLWTPIEIFFFPIICWAAWTMAGAANVFLLLVLYESPILSNPPYNFSSASVGFANFAPAVGAIIGLTVAGPFSDWVAMRATRRNNGIREPEMRLPALIPFLVISTIGLVVSRAPAPLSSSF
jgi:MFS family permease